MTAGCPPLLGMIRADRGEGRSVCNQQNSAVIAFLDEASHIKTVVLHARWAIAVEGLRAPSEPGRPALFVPEIGLIETAHFEKNHAYVAQAIQEAIKQLRQRDLEVIIIDTVPEIDRFVPQALFSAHYTGSAMPRAPDLKTTKIRNQRFRASIEPLLEDRNVRSVSPADYLCAPIYLVEKDGKAVYRDDDRLSIWGARFLAPDLMDQAFMFP